MKKWLKAAERYIAAKQPGFKARKKRPKKEKPIPTLAQFMASDEGEAARKLLAAVGTYVLLGESEKIMGETVSVSLDGDGLKRSSQVVGLAAAYTEKKPQQEVIHAHEALELLEKFPKKDYLGKEVAPDFLYEEDLTFFIRKRLDEIADEAP